MKRTHRSPLATARPGGFATSGPERARPAARPAGPPHPTPLPPRTQPPGFALSHTKCATGVEMP
eukprot:7658486-Pyramimonas_sp.AAC.1